MSSLILMESPPESALKAVCECERKYGALVWGQTHAGVGIRLLLLRFTEQQEPELDWRQRVPRLQVTSPV